MREGITNISAILVSATICISLVWRVNKVKTESHKLRNDAIQEIRSNRALPTHIQKAYLEKAEELEIPWFDSRDYRRDIALIVYEAKNNDEIEKNKK